MYNDNLLTEALGYIDDAYITEYLETERKIAKRNSVYKRRPIISIIVAAALICSLVVGASASYAIYQANIEKEDEGKVFLDLYWEERRAQTDMISLKEIYAESRALVENSKAVVFEKNLFVDRFTKNRYFAEKDLKYKIDLLQISADPDKNFEREVYLVFIASLTNCFADHVYYGDYDYFSHHYNRPMSTLIMFSSDYKEMGFDTPEDYHNAIRSGECTPSENTYLISFESYSICRFFDNVDVYNDIRDSAIKE